MKWKKENNVSKLTGPGGSDLPGDGPSPGDEKSPHDDHTGITHDTTNPIKSDDDEL